MLGTPYSHEALFIILKLFWGHFQAFSLFDSESGELQEMAEQKYEEQPGCEVVQGLALMLCT